MPGTRDENALESALARPRQRFAYEPDTDLAALAAPYAYGLARDHPYNDGNKRVAFVVMAVFLGLNGSRSGRRQPAEPLPIGATYGTLLAGSPALQQTPREVTGYM